MPPPAPLLPPLPAAALLAAGAGAAALANCALAAAILRHTTNGLYSIILQLIVADCLLLGASIAPDLWSVNARMWQFGEAACVAYRGLSVLLSTASLYLVATVALHSLASMNLEEKIARRKIKRSVRDEDDELQSSRHSLVANSDSSTPPRTMHLDYRISDTRIRVAPPTVFIWILSISLSVPEFALTTTIKFDTVNICALADTGHQINMRTMLAVFNLFLPSLIMFVTSALIIMKLKRNRLPDLKDSETVAALKLSLALLVVYCVMCLPRCVMSFYRAHSSSNIGITGIKYYQDETLIDFAFISLYLFAMLARPLLCIFMLPRIRNTLTFGAQTSTLNNV